MQRGPPGPTYLVSSLPAGWFHPLFSPFPSTLQAQWPPVYPSNMLGPCMLLLLLPGTFFPEIVTCLLLLFLQILPECHLSEAFLTSLFKHTACPRLVPSSLPAYFSPCTYDSEILCIYLLMSLLSIFLTPLKFKLQEGRAFCCFVWLLYIHPQCFDPWQAHNDEPMSEWMQWSIFSVSCVSTYRL